MKRSIIAILAILASAWLPPMQQQAHAEELTLQTYLALTLGRLQIVRDVWARQVTRATNSQIKPPGAEDLAPLMKQYGVTEEEYLAFASRHQQALHDYLAANPEINAKIEQLSSDIKSSIQRMDASETGTARGQQP